MNELLETLGNLQNCAWSHWAPATLRFCEAHLCERIVAPAETWSNFAYFIVAGLLFFKEQTRFGIYALVVGIASTFFHASYTYVFETADLAAMNLLGVEMVIQGIRKVGWMRGRSPLVLALVLFIGSFFVLLGTRGSDRLVVFGGLVAVVLWLEALGYVRDRRLGTVGNYRAFGQTLVLFLIAMGFWILDYTGLVCVPDRHWFSGHAAWHVLNAGCFLTLSAFYRTR